MQLRYLLVLSLLMMTGIVSAQSSVIPYGKNAKAGKYADIRGFKMYYETYGTGEPLLIIHGNGGSIGDFNFQIPYFEKKYKVILADSRAQGKSLDNGDSLTYEMMADDLDALLDVLKLDSCYVIGWSDGGINGLLLAMRHPEKVRKLAVTGANLWPDSSAIDPYHFTMVSHAYDSTALLEKTTNHLRNLKLLHLLAHQPHITTEQLGTIKCPTLVIGGDHDIILPQHTLLIAESILKSYLWILPNAGHATLIFNSEAFNKTVYEFFKNPYRNIEGPARSQ
ncbi:MAG: alpha/beta hydrolase [Saprospiraceae bacterium]|nr:alpha/beta hydrolase [Candidatus Opimibacter skivensis]